MTRNGRKHSRFTNWIVDIAKNFSINSIMFFFAILAAGIIIFLPVLLSFSCFRDFISDVISPLGTPAYIGEYLSAIGGLIGSFLAVTSAIWIQNRSEQKQKADHIRKYAAIVYYDIDLFYKENSPFLKEVAAVNKDAPSSERLDTSTLSKLMCKRSNVYVNRNWIVDVAELACELDGKTIQQIYRFYGYVSDLMTAIRDRMVFGATYGDIKEIHRLATKIGGFNVSKDYIISTEYRNLLKNLEVYITTDDDIR